MDDELNIIEEVIKDYKIKLNDLEIEQKIKEKEFENKLKKEKEREERRNKNILILNENNKAFEIKNLTNKFYDSINKIIRKYLNEIKLFKNRYEKEINKIYNKYKLINGKEYIYHKNKIKLLENKYNIKNLNFDKKIENMNNLIKINEIIFNTYNSYNDNYYNCININSLLLNYCKNNYIKNKIMKKIFGSNCDNKLDIILQKNNDDIKNRIKKENQIIKKENNKNTENDNKKEQNFNYNSFIRKVIKINEYKSFFNSISKYGLCCFYNLDDSSYLNSSISCLCNCLELTIYFLAGKYEQDIKNNKIHNKTNFGSIWKELLGIYWNINYKKNPLNNIIKFLKNSNALENKDSYEIIIKLLELLNEDNNKELIIVYQKNQNELSYAINFWNLYIKNNNSIILDLFYGLIKLTIHCNECGNDSIIFKPFNSLDLSIPVLTIFYIPKYSIKESIRITLIAKKGIQLKEFIEEVNKIKEFHYKLKILKFIQVNNSQLIRFIDENEYIKKDEFIIAFDDETKGKENIYTIPLYIYKNEKVSVFPRLLFIEKNMNFGQFKRNIYYFARKYFVSPFKNKFFYYQGNYYDIDKELKNYKMNDDEKPYYDEEYYFY